MKKVLISEVMKTLDAFAPRELALDYDNVGLMCGSVNRQTSGVLVCLDITSETLKEAVSKKVNLVVSHHPLIFNAQRCIDLDSQTGALIEFAIKNDITVLSYHTNLDFASGGVNYRLAQRLGGQKIELVCSGACFNIEKSMTLKEYAKFCAHALSDPSVKISGQPGKLISRVFSVSGAGGRDEDAYAFARENSDVFVSSEVKHNLLVSAQSGGFALIEISHYNSEIISLDILFDIIKSTFCDLDIYKSQQTRPFRTAEEL